MMAMPASTSRPRRHSSTSAANIVPAFSSGIPFDTALPPMAPWTNSRARNGSAGTREQPSAVDTERNTSTQQIVGGTARMADGNMGEVRASVNRWSHSTNSSFSTFGHHRGLSSVSRRFSLGAAALSGPRSPSPHRPRRPTDAQAPIGSPSTSTARLASSPPRDSFTVDAHTEPPNADTASSSARPLQPAFVPSEQTTPPRTQPSASPNTAVANSERAINGLLASPQSPDDGSGLSHRQTGSPRAHASHPSRSSRPSNASSQDAQNANGARSRIRKDREKKAMLARALQRANDAVELDNAQKYSEALKAYEESCDYLERVLDKSTHEDDISKLTKIRGAYVTRIAELKQNEVKEVKVPAEEVSNVEVRTVTIDESPKASKPSRNTLDGAFESIEQSLMMSSTQASDTAGTDYSSKRLPSLPKESNGESSRTATGQDAGTDLDVSHRGRTHNRGPSSELGTPMDATYMPRPLSPRRSPVRAAQPAPTARGNDSVTLPASYVMNLRDHDQEVVGEDKSLPERARASTTTSLSSHHSRSSHDGLRRKQLLRRHGGDTEAAFDAALDAAVEAAYAEGYEPFDVEAYEPDPPQSTNAPADRDSTRYYALESRMPQATRQKASKRTSRGKKGTFEPLEDDGADTDEEERRLEEEIGEPLDEDSPLEPPPPLSRPPVPRQSDSSASSSARTWEGSVTSSLNTLGSSLSPVEENFNTMSLVGKHQSLKGSPPAPPPTTALPPPPTTSSSRGPSPSRFSTSVQDRRVSSSKTRKLKIETSVGAKQEPPAPAQLSIKVTGDTSTPQASPKLKSLAPPSTLVQRPTEPGSPVKGRSITSPFPSPFPTQGHSMLSGASPSGMAPLSARSNDSNSLRPSPQSPGLQSARSTSDKPYLNKNPSSVSLKNKALLTPNAETWDTSPGTPMSFAFSNTLSAPTSNKVPMNTPVVGAFAPQVQQQRATKVDLFNEINPPHTPYSPPRSASNLPRQLEACPENFLLRPFWILRCVYQTIAHPRGGYLSNKLFIPNQVWHTKNVKLRSPDDKVDAMDHLTAALLKLSAVDTYDADAVLEEMQSFEQVMEQVQAQLAKKLGSEVGVHSVSGFFKDAPPPSKNSPASPDRQLSNVQSNTESLNSQGNTTSTGSGGGKESKTSSSSSRFSSWRKLRSKNSSTALTSSYASQKEVALKENISMSTVPMTSAAGVPTRFAKREENLAKNSVDIKADGPHAKYVAALAKLCEAAQVLDQIARQVEDPGLKHSSPTHVGLELSARHAAEFFGFYVCRFVLQDMILLTEKFMKRATEWVLS